MNEKSLQNSLSHYSLGNHFGSHNGQQGINQSIASISPIIGLANMYACLDIYTFCNKFSNEAVNSMIL